MKFLFIIALIAAINLSKAQSIRSLNNDGVEEFEKKNFSEAEIKFRKGLEKEPDNKTLKLNLGGSYYKQSMYDDAMKSYNETINALTDKKEKSKAYYNLGNSLLKQEKYKESIEAFKNALKNNPQDSDAKYNLSYALKKLQDQQNQDKNQDKDQDKDQNKDDKNNQDQKNEQDKDNQDKQDQQDQQNKQNQEQQKDQEKNQQKQGQDKPKISKEDAERILTAMKNNEKEMQKKLRKQEGVRVKVEKDW
ncbi:MAG: tetratricopeptide repeat protein [Ignavibacteriaceae bacterium]|nr:tetratricopeptide repeat protein [Ignavibacteriaceae bacterium]